MISTMLNILAVILNILGFIALVLFCILLFMLIVIALVLIVPFRYKCEGSISGKSFTGFAQVSWMLGLVSMRFDDTNTITFRLFGICVWRQKDIPAEPAAPKPDVAQATVELTSRPASSKESKAPHVKYQQKEQKSSEPKKSIKAKLDDFISEIKGTWQKISYYKNHPDRTEIIGQTKLLIKRVFKAALPKRVELGGSFGFEDPSHTGFATGAMSIFAQIGYPRIRLTAMPDFTQQILELNLLAKGKVMIIALLLPLLRFLFCKPVWGIVRPLIFPKKHRKRKQRHSPSPQSV